jgi:hypothetical protein
MSTLSPWLTNIATAEALIHALEKGDLDMAQYRQPQTLALRPSGILNHGTGRDAEE